MEPYFDLGTYTRGTSTASTSAQTWFDRGLVWSYAFHHEEAIRCFERAVEHDAGFALARWGIAYTLGPNYNKQWEAFDPVDLAASLEKACDEVAARAVASPAPVERALVEALGSRYQAYDPSADLVAWNADYVEAMREVYRAHPDDVDVAALFADALMNLTPWALWDRYTGLPSDGAATLEAKEVLERALDRPGGREHPGLVHLYVHLMEMSPFPERALPVADQLRSLVPDAGHLIHMPTHIDVLCGDYKSTLESNLRAIEVNEKYVAREGRVGLYALYTRTTATSRSTERCSSAGRRSRWTSPPTSRPHCPRSCCGRAAADGRLPRGVRAHAPTRAHPLRDVGGHPRAAAARRPRALLHHDRDDALCARRRVRGDRADGGSQGSA